MAARDNKFFRYVWEMNNHQNWNPIFIPEKVIIAYSSFVDKRVGKIFKSGIPRDCKNELRVASKWFSDNSLLPSIILEDRFTMVNYIPRDDSKEKYDLFQLFMESSLLIPSTEDILRRAIETSYIPIKELFTKGVPKRKRLDYYIMLKDNYTNRKTDEPSKKNTIEESVVNTINSIIDKSTTVLAVDELLKNNSDLIFNKEDFLNESQKYRDVKTDEQLGQNINGLKEENKENMCIVDSTDTINAENSQEIESVVLSEDSYDTNKHIEKVDTSIDNEREYNIDEMMSYLRQLGTI